jgi:hypothetical protein
MEDGGPPKRAKKAPKAQRRSKMATKSTTKTTKNESAARRKTPNVSAARLEKHSGPSAAKIQAAMAASEELPLCLCGCGSTVRRPGSRFLQGHDAALKGYLQRHYLNAPRPTDPTIAHLAGNFAAVTGTKVDANAEAILVAVNPDWRQFLGSKQMREKAEKLANRAKKAAGNAAEKVGKTAKAAVAKVKQQAAKASAEIRRIVGTSVKTGTVVDGKFRFTNSAGVEVSIPLGRTKAVPTTA